MAEKSQNKIRDAREAMRYAIISQKKYYDQHHSGIPPYKAGDFVTLRLDLHPVAIIRHNKLSQQKLPPCEIKSILSGGRALELNLPENIGIHPVVSVQQVERAPNPLQDPWHRDYLWPQAIDDKGEIFKIEIIAEKILWNGSKKYKVHWIGYPSSDDQWLRSTDVTDELIAEY